MEKISWTTIEYLHTHKTSDWYWVVGAITVSAAIIAIILNNIIFAILLLISGFTLSLFAARPPKEIEVELNQNGIIFGNIMYPYSELDSFWVETNDPFPKLLIKSKRLFMHFILIYIEEVPPEEIRAFLSKHLKQERHSEPFLEKLLLYLGF